jgi:hypothetical protein
MKRLAIALMVLGVIVIGLGGAMYASSEQQKYCEEFRLKAVALAEEAVKAEGTPRAQELMDESESESAMADQTCDSADSIRQQCLLIAGGGFLLLVVGFVLSRRKPAAQPVA